jgi:hypothetical protein
MKRKKCIPQNRDRNVERAFTAGYATRLAAKPLARCPDLTPVFGERYGTQLMDSWMRGWYAADAQLRQPLLMMEVAAPCR